YTTAGTYVDTLMAPGGCDSIVTTTLTINPIPTVALMGLAANYGDCFPAVMLTGTPSGGTFSGPGVTGSSFDPGAAGAGTHSIVYNYTDSLTTCSNSDTVTTMVFVCLGIEDGFLTVNIAPNPNNGQFKLNGMHPGMEYRIFNLQGKLLLSKTAKYSSETVVLQDQAAGIYFLQLNFEGKSQQMKIVID
ncbi:MAG TPA: T9SS type A sorting domain-containing protein, partial [Bacteroidetes bacterium]|nr:T9SS type A sorting domain-containing protein [Bacteroidota bacterium]